MRTRTVLSFFAVQWVLVGLGAWAEVAGGAVWLLVVLVSLSLTAGMRLMVQAELESARRPLEDELKMLRVISKAPVITAPAQIDTMCTADSSQALLQRIAQLEAEMRLLCPPDGRQNPPVELPVPTGVVHAE